MSEKKITPERWRMAQEWELSIWDRAEFMWGWRKLVWPFVRPLYRLAGNPTASRDDYNHWWARHFDGYSFLPDVIGNYIELGCGPYTNTRIILENRKAEYVVCSDPLIRHYLKYPRTWLTKKYLRGEIFVDNHPIEDCPYGPGYFDVVVMINVLDHVMDSDACLENAIRITKRNGFLVLGQDLTDESDIARYPFDTGHPIRLGYEDIEPYLGRFTHVCHKLLPRNEGRAPDAHYSTLLFAGRLNG